MGPSSLILARSCEWHSVPLVPIPREGKRFAQSQWACDMCPSCLTLWRVRARVLGVIGAFVRGPLPGKQMQPRSGMGRERVPGFLLCGFPQLLEVEVSSKATLAEPSAQRPQVPRTPNYCRASFPVSYTHLTLPTTGSLCRSRWSPYH